MPAAPDWATRGDNLIFWGLNVNTMPLSVVHRLPHHYRWLAGFTGVKVEPVPPASDGDNLIGLKLLSHDGDSAWQVLEKLRLTLAEIQVDSSVVEWEGEPCLFVGGNDEDATLCRLKNVGAAIADSLKALYPF